MMTRLKTVAVLGVLFAMVLNSSAVEGVQLSFQGSDVVLSWPSQQQQTFIVGYKPNLDPGTQWTFLTTTLPATAGSQTTFIHAGAFQGGGGQMMATAGSGPTEFLTSTKLTEDEIQARRIATREAAQKAFAQLIAQLESAVAKANKMLAKRKSLPSSQSVEAISTSERTLAVTSSAASPTTSGMGFYFVTDYDEDVDGDLLPNDWELAIGTSILKADTDGDTIDDGMEDLDGDGRANYLELVAGTDPFAPDDLITYTYLTSGTAIREEFDVSLSSPEGIAAASPPAIDTRLAAYGNDADGIGGMYARVVDPNGTVQVRFYSIFIQGAFFAATEGGGGFDLSPAKLQQLGAAYGPGTRSRSGLFSTPNANQLAQVPTDTLDRAAQLHSAKAKEFWIKANSANITPAQRRVYIDAVDTQVSRFNAVRRAIGRVGQGLIPLAIIGGVLVAIDVYGSQQELLDAANAYHATAWNGDDLCDPAIDVAAWANNVAPPSFNVVWDHLCP